MALTPTAADRLPVDRDYAVLFPGTGQPLIQALRKPFGIQTFKHPPECVAVRDPVRKFQKISKSLSALFDELLHVLKILTVADQCAQPDYDDILQLMPDISMVCPPRILYPRQFGSQFF